MQKHERTMTDATQGGAGDSGAVQGARVGAQVGTVVGTAVGTAVEEAVQRASEAAALVAEGYGVVRERVAAVDTDAVGRQLTDVRDRIAALDADTVTRQLSDVRDRIAAADTGALVKQWGGVLEGVVEDGRDRAVAVLGRQKPAPRRWPWVAGALAGAAAGAGVAFAIRRLVGQDAPGAQEPDQLRAVVDPGTLPVPPADDAPAL